MSRYEADYLVSFISRYETETSTGTFGILYFKLNVVDTKYLILNLYISNKMNCELMLTYDTPALWQTGSRNLTGQKTLPTIWGTYMKRVTKYQISAINSC